MTETASPREEEVELVAGGTDVGRRVDEFVASALALGRRAATRLMERTRVNGRPASKGQRLRAGDVVRLRRPHGDERASGGVAPEVVRASEKVLVLAKPAGLPSVALRGGSGDSLAARIAAHFPDCALVGKPGESGLVHRLDTGTSGLLLAARSEHAYQALREQFRAHGVRKEYLALVAGRLVQPLRIATPIGQHRNTLRRMRAVASEAGRRRYAPRPACTDVAVERRFTDATLVRASTTTGVRHQIRVHLASIGHPLLGDPLYADAERTGMDGFLLHAAAVDWHDPASGDAQHDELALPARWQPFLDRLAGDR